MQRLHEWFRKHKAKVLIPILLCLVTVPLALTACGSAASEDTERPKTPFELESEIQSLQADMETIKGDTAWLRTSLVSLQGTAAKDWTADINSIISRLSAIEAKLNAVSTPTPTATSQGGWPVPTATATQTGGITATFDIPINNVNNKSSGIGVWISNYGIVAECRLVLTLSAKYGDTDVKLTPTAFTESSGAFTQADMKCSPQDDGDQCTAVYLYSSKFSVPSGGRHVVIGWDFVTEDANFYWTPSLSIVQ